MNIIQIVAGLLIGLFVPGYLAARILFKELSELEKIALGFVLSLAIDIAVGLFLGYNARMKEITGGITALNLWLYLGTITILLFIAYLFFNRTEWQHLLKREDSEAKVAALIEQEESRIGDVPDSKRTKIKEEIEVYKKRLRKN